MSFAALLIRYMERIGISDQQLADKVEKKLPYNRDKKTSRQTIYKWRTGEVKRPTCEKVAMCAEVLRLDSEECDEFFQAAGCSAQNNYGIDYESGGGPLVPVTTRPIIHPRQFFGREALLERIFNEWRQLPLQHVAVCGPKLSGKTSLLNYLRYVHNDNILRQGQRYDWFRQRYCWVFVDFLQIHRPENFWRCVLKELGLPYNKVYDWFDFTDVLDAQLQPTVILMDRVDIGLQSLELDEEFWSNMRYLGQHCAGGRVGFCVASRYPLAELEYLAEEVGKPSPFCNVFSEFKLGALTEDEARTLLGAVPVPFSQDDIDWILEQSLCWPVLLQVLCKVRLSGGEDWRAVGLEEIVHLKRRLG